MAATLNPDVKEKVYDPKLGNHKHAVMAFNNDKTSFMDVVGVFIVSCGYSEALAHQYTWEIHNNGMSICYWNTEEKCKDVIKDFHKINVKAELMTL